MYGYVYKGINLINNKIYIGQHKAQIFDESYFGSGTLWKRAINKYGLENIKIEIIEWCESREKLNEREAYWIKILNSQNKKIGYNISGSDSAPHSMPGEKNPMYGKKHSQETKNKISEKAKNRVMSEKTKQKISNSLKGKKDSNETKKKRSESLKGVKPSKNTIEAIIKANSTPVEILDENLNVIASFEKATDLPKFFGMKNYNICFTKALDSNCKQMYKGYYLKRI